MVSLPSRRVRVGCDLVELAEIENSLAEFGDRFLHRLFTDAELNDCRGPNRIHRLAARFAAKEAVIKAFAEPESPFVPRQIEVALIRSVPTVQLYGAAAQLSIDQGWTETSLSLTHADCHAAAVIVVVCANPDS